MLLLRYYSGLKFREIAARLNLPISNVYARLDSACGMLRRLLFCDSRWSWLREEFRDQFSFGGIVSKIAIPDRGQSNSSAIGSKVPKGHPDQELICVSHTLGRLRQLVCF